LQAHNGTKLTYCQISQATSHHGPIAGVIQSAADRLNETATSLQAEHPELTRSAQELQTTFNSGLQSFIEEAQKVSQASVFERIS